MFRWLLEHAVGNLNRCSVTPEGMTPYQHIHGKRVTQKQGEVSEKVCYYLPKRVRAKLDNRYHLGIDLGQVSSSNECYVATANGGVIKTRSIARIVSNRCWDAPMTINIKGIPKHPNLGDPEAVDFDSIEEREDPHRHTDDIERDRLDDDRPGEAQTFPPSAGLSEEAMKTMYEQIRITRTLRPDNVPWDFNRKEDRKMARDIMHSKSRRWIVGSPPYTAFCQWNLGINKGKVNPLDFLERKEEGKRQLSFACKTYHHQINTGNYFVHEHLAGASSWKEPELVRLRNLPGV